MLAILVPRRAESGTPGSHLLSVTRMEIHEQHPHMAAVGFLHLIGHRLLMVKRHVIPLLEGDAIKLVRGIENSVHGIVEGEIGLDLAFVEVELLLPQLLAVIPPVPGRQFEVAPFAVDDLLHGIAVGSGDLHGRGPELQQKIIDRFRRLGHVDIDHVFRIIVEAQELPLLVAQLHQLFDDLLVVKFVVVVAAHEIPRV